MCGIAGFYNPSREADEHRNRSILDRMCQVIRHRGPDDQGMMVARGLALGMRRLAIIDLSGGHQPIANEDGRVTVVFNGEIYNFRQLMDELEMRGHRFATHCDTEVIVHSYEEFGLECIRRFRGMFGFAVWDDRQERLFIGRDRPGEKPLYYTLTAQGTFVFGSELKSLLVHPEVKREIDPLALDAYLTLGYIPDPLCIFRDIHKLPPGHYLTFSRGQVQVERYWDVTPQVDRLRREEEYREELRRLLEESVRIRLISDVPLGAFLSGGVDSSTVVGFMARHSSTPVKTFSIGFREEDFSELEYARVTARKFATEHHEFVVTPAVWDTVRDMAWHFDEPFADSSAIPTYLVSRMAREHVTVALSGDGGDELFAGYTRYAIDRKREGVGGLPFLVRQAILRPLSEGLPQGAHGRNYLYNLSLDRLHRYLDSVSVFNGLSRKSLYGPSLRSTLSGQGESERLFSEYGAQVSSPHWLDTLTYVDTMTYLPGDILTKVDRMTMAASLEGRAPLLDHLLMEFAATVPASLKMKGLSTKHIMKEAVRGLVPDEILDRPKKGFAVPLKRWLCDELREPFQDMLAARSLRERGWFAPDYLDQISKEHLSGRRDHSGRLWALFMLERWYQTYMEDDFARVQPAGTSLVREAVAV